MVLARIAIHHGLQGYAGLPHPDLTKRSEVHILGTLIEAIIAAVWTDTNRDLHAVKRLLLVLYGFMGR
jgi:dsRNA-specific ribonuclease